MGRGNESFFGASESHDQDGRHVHGLTLTYFIARSNLVPFAFIWENLLESHLMKETCSK